MTSHVMQPIALSLTPSRGRRQLRDLLVEARWAGDVDGALLAFHEALVNAHQHGGGASRAEARLDGSVVIVQIWDHGSGFEVPGRTAAPEPMAERGRGLWLIGRVASDWEIRRDDDGVSLVLQFKSAAA